MDITAPFKSEVLRPITTWVIPGAIALGPYVLILGFYVPPVRQFWETHPSASIAVITLFVLTVGMILENVGATIETVAWDQLVQRKYSDHLNNWNRYLKLRLKDEIIGHRYLKTLVLRMKFELSMAPALFVFWCGIIWVNALFHVWLVPGVVFISALLLAGSVYFLRSSYTSVRVLSEVRALILEAIAAEQAAGASTPARVGG